MSGLLTQARRQAHAQRVKDNESRLVELLQGDFEEIETRYDINLLRNYIRKNYHIEATEPVTDDMLYGGWLSLKRRLVSPLETVTIRPLIIGVQGTFASKGAVQPIVVPTYNGVYCDRCGHYTITADISLPLMSAFVNESPYRVTVMTPNGDFCDIDERQGIISLNCSDCNTSPYSE